MEVHVHDRACNIVTIYKLFAHVCVCVKKHAVVGVRSVPRCRVAPMASANQGIEGDEAGREAASNIWRFIVNMSGFSPHHFI